MQSHMREELEIVDFLGELVIVVVQVGDFMVRLHRGFINLVLL